MSPVLLFTALTPTYSISELSSCVKIILFPDGVAVMGMLVANL